MSCTGEQSRLDVGQGNSQTSLVLPSGLIIFVVDSQKAPPLLMEPGVTKDVAVDIHIFNIFAFLSNTYQRFCC